MVARLHWLAIACVLLAGCAAAPKPRYATDPYTPHQERAWQNVARCWQSAGYSAAVDAPRPRPVYRADCRQDPRYGVLVFGPTTSPICGLYHPLDWLEVCPDDGCIEHEFSHHISGVVRNGNDGTNAPNRVGICYGVQ